jgi:hypothetical protein
MARREIVADLQQVVTALVHRWQFEWLKSIPLSSRKQGVAED